MKTSLSAALLAALLAFGAVSAAHAQAQTQAGAAGQADSLFHATTLNLSASGEEKLAPDMATISLGVTSEAPTAAHALSDNAAQMSQVMAALKAQGVVAKDIRTSGLSLMRSTSTPRTSRRS